MTLISRSTPSIDDQRHAVNTTLHFWRFKITTLSSSSYLRYSGNLVTLQTALIFFLSGPAGTRRRYGERVYAKAWLVESRWRCIMNVGRRTWRRASKQARVVSLDDDNKSWRGRWRECLRKAPSRSTNRVLLQWVALLLRRGKGLRVIDLNWILWETYFIVNYLNGRYAWAATNLAESLKESLATFVRIWICKGFNGL